MGGYLSQGRKDAKNFDRITGSTRIGVGIFYHPRPERALEDTEAQRDFSKIGKGSCQVTVLAPSRFLFKHAAKHCNNITIFRRRGLLMLTIMPIIRILIHAGT